MTASARAPAPRCRARDNAIAASAASRADRLAGLFELVGPLLVALELREPPAALAGVPPHVRERLAVLPRELAQELPPRPDLLESLRVVLHRVACDAQVPAELGELRLRGAEPFGELCERTAARQCCRRRADRVERRALDGAVRGCQGFAMRQRVGEQRLLGFERDVFARIVEAGGLDLVDLKAQEVELARTGPVVPAESSELGVDASHLGSGGTVRGEGIRCRRADEAIERGSLHRGREEGLVRVLAMQIDQTGAHVGELADGREPPVDVGPAAPVQRHHAREDDLVAGLGVDESTFDAALRRRRRARASCRRGLRRGARPPRPAASCPRRSRR